MTKNTNKKQPFSHKKTSLYVLVVLAVLVSVLFVTLFSKRLIQIGHDQGVASTAVMGVTAQRISNGVIEIVASPSEKAATIPNVYELDEGTTAVCVPVTVRNVSGSEKLFIPLEEIQLYDTSTKKSYPIAGVLTCAPGVGGPVQVGEELTGKLGFLLPDNYGPLELHYNPLDKNTKPFIISNI